MPTNDNGRVIRNFTVHIVNLLAFLGSLQYDLKLLLVIVTWRWWRLPQRTFEILAATQFIINLRTTHPMLSVYLLLIRGNFLSCGIIEWRLIIYIRLLTHHTESLLSLLKHHLPVLQFRLIVRWRITIFNGVSWVLFKLSRSHSFWCTKRWSLALIIYF